MRILYMGTPDFAVLPLKALIEAGHEVCAVITQPDKPTGRGYKMTPPPVKVAALEAGIPVYQPETLRNNAMAALLEELSPELIAVAAYGKILPEYVLNFPKYGCLNVHASLLPKYRGAAPINRCIMEGETETGVTIMYMEKGLDTGDMLAKCATAITDEDNAESLHDRLAAMGAKLLVQTLDLLDEITPVKQDDAAHTYAPMIEKSDCRIDFTKSSREVFNQIRGLSPFPGAFTTLDGKVLKVYAAAIVSGHGTPATVIDGEGLTVACGEGAVRLTVIKPEGKKSMTDSQYLNGHPIEKGVVLK